ncbi:hypothetical protein C2G38_2048264 [Gigaspora rosea]|uniref:Uncharacterized protein n=1 Tax=Gigaspora rosea TaxID=44941 RepID=A0A397UBF5_9GLOM|nr:hypothetical protein C2G38_2048264 [Gigaspora rosea]
MRFFARIVVVPLWFLPFEFNSELPFSILEVVIDYGRIKISHQLLLSRGYLIVLLFRSLSNLLILSYMALQQIRQDLYERSYLSRTALQQMCQDFYGHSELYDSLAIRQGFFLLLDNVFEYFYFLISNFLSAMIILEEVFKACQSL